MLLCSFAATVSAQDGDAELGRRLYETGMLADGSPLSAERLGRMSSDGDILACAQCHRRSGMGSQEGEIVVPPITGKHLYSRPRPRRLARHRYPARPVRADRREAYDNTLLARAIREGVDASAQPLNNLMPRYRIGEPDMRNLLAYLHRLSSTTPPGVTPGHLRLATILTPDAEADRRRVVAETIRAWASKDKLSHLDIDVDIWSLEGNPSTWAAQLEQAYAAQPVFAVISGAGSTQWNPVAAFCESYALPCIFPIVDAAPLEPAGHFSFYLDGGIGMEALLLGRVLSQHPDSSTLIQIVEDEAGARAAHSLCKHAGSDICDIRVWNDRQPVVMSEPDKGRVIAWLRPVSLHKFFTQARASPELLVLSARLASPDAIDVPASLRRVTRWISTRVAPGHEAALNKIWLEPRLAQFGLPRDHDRVRAELNVALHYFSDALARMRGQWQREYLLELLEDGHYTRPVGNIFVSLSLASGQRVVAKSAQLLGFLPPDFAEIGPVSGKLQP